MIKLIFLIDYENVRSEGLIGSDYLLPEDTLILFYSIYALQCEQRYMDMIERSGCRFETAKLVKKGKNGLDFYIAARIGELRASGNNDTIVIVSGDTGYMAVKDYIDPRYPDAKKILITKTIKEGILRSGEKSERFTKTQKDYSSINLDAYVSQKEEAKDVKDALKGTKYASKTKEIQRIVNKDNHMLPVYHTMRSTFGKKDGIAIYRILKNKKKLISNGGNKVCG